MVIYGHVEPLQLRSALATTGAIQDFLRKQIKEDEKLKTLINTLVLPRPFSYVKKLTFSFFVTKFETISYSLRELRNYILRIIRLWSLSFSVRVYLILNFLPIILGKQFFIFLCLICFRLLGVLNSASYLGNYKIQNSSICRIIVCISAIWPLVILFLLYKNNFSL